MNISKVEKLVKSKLEIYFVKRQKDDIVKVIIVSTNVLQVLRSFFFLQNH